MIPVILAGVFSVIGLFLWYKDYSYFYWGEVEPVVAMSYERYDPDDGEKINALYNSNFAERSDVIEALAWYTLENHMQLKTTNNGDSSLFLSVYDYHDYIEPVLKESMIEILPGDYWTYDTKGGSYMLVVYGTGVGGGRSLNRKGFPLLRRMQTICMPAKMPLNMFWLV